MHPNISSTGAICNAVVKSPNKELRIIDRVNALIGLLQVPNAENGYSNEACNLFVFI